MYHSIKGEQSYETLFIEFKKIAFSSFCCGDIHRRRKQSSCPGPHRIFPLLQLLGGPDHIKCYEIEDSFRLNSTTVDISTPQFPLEPGCKIKEAELFCVPAFKGIPKDRKVKPLTLLPVPSAPVFNDFICYEIECKKPFPHDQEVTDKFKKRVIRDLEPALLCTPAEKKCSSDAVCEDGIACTDDSCDTGTGVCQHKPVTCDDENECTDDSCDPETGECVNTENTNSCEDGDTCTTGDICSDGECTPGTTMNCDDNNDCTNDSCDPISGACSNVNENTNTCDDGNICTDGDKCINGICRGKQPINKCDDGNVCTDDSCDPDVEGGCVHTNNSAPCDDRNVCTSGETCSNGNCVPGPGAINCKDDDPCTNDSCDPTTGCVNDGASCPRATPTPEPTPTPGDGGGPGVPAPTTTPGDGGGPVPATAPTP
ncbi:MAG: hypothetical protein ACREOW_16765 [Thermodesulfobacteriota bacterium]